MNNNLFERGKGFFELVLIGFVLNRVCYYFFLFLIFNYFYIKKIKGRKIKRL